MIYRAALACSVVVALFFSIIAAAPARDVGQWESTDLEISTWYRSLMQPDNPTTSCCGEADAYWADEVVVKDGKVFAVVTDTRPDEPLKRPHIDAGTLIEVPTNKYKFDRGNPTGHNILFVGYGKNVYCFVQGSGT